MGGLTEAIRQVVNERLRTVWTTSIARIDRVYVDDYRCDVTLAYTIDGSPVSLSKVPIMVHRTSGSAILLPYKAGDLVVVIFNRCTNNSVLQYNTQAELGTPTFGLNNAIVVASLVSMPEREQLLYNGITLKVPTDEIVIVNNTNLRLVSPGITFINDALPTATVALRSQIRVVQGAAGVADKMYLCIKNSSNTYEWKEVRWV